ncbi:MAG: CocE/NonD family hydrolase, partial [Ignavibacteriales bacterium]|nr:CocE/NonD family hydrolase [Ignavibacteriales bacterium]
VTQWYNAAFMSEDQRFAARRPDVLVYETTDLTEDFTIAGPIDVHLNASTSGTDCDWIVKVIDVFPDSTRTPRPTAMRGRVLAGYQMLVRGDVLRGKFRNSLSKPEPFLPNRVTPVHFVLQDAFHTFKRGHRIMVQIQSTWFPMIDRNPGKIMDIYKAKDSDFQKTTQRVYHSSKFSSRVTFGALNK